MNIRRITSDFVNNFKINAVTAFFEMLRKDNNIKVQSDIATNRSEEQKQPNLIKNYKAFIGKGNNWNVVKLVLKNRSWWSIVEKFKKDDTNFVWTQWLKKKYFKHLPRYSEEIDLNNANLMYNRLEGNYSISNKKDLFLNLSQYYAKTGEDIFKNVPLTFVVKNGIKDDSFLKFEAYCQENKKEKFWIVKPGEYSNRGQGITL